MLHQGLLYRNGDGEVIVGRQILIRLRGYISVCPTLRLSRDDVEYPMLATASANPTRLVRTEAVTQEGLECSERDYNRRGFRECFIS